MNYLPILKKSHKVLVWTAVDRNRIRFAGLEVGDARIETFKKLWKAVSSLNKIEIVCSDGNSIYGEFFKNVDGIKHYTTKSETCLVESFNSKLRYYLARLSRKTKCYSKSAEMLNLSLKL